MSSENAPLVPIRWTRHADALDFGPTTGRLCGFYMADDLKSLVFVHYFADRHMAVSLRKIVDQDVPHVKLAETRLPITIPAAHAHAYLDAYLGGCVGKKLVQVALQPGPEHGLTYPVLIVTDLDRMTTKAFQPFPHPVTVPPVGSLTWESAFYLIYPGFYLRVTLGDDTDESTYVCKSFGNDDEMTTLHSVPSEFGRNFFSDGPVFFSLGADRRSINTFNVETGTIKTRAYTLARICTTPPHFYVRHYTGSNGQPRRVITVNEPSTYDDFYHIDMNDATFAPAQTFSANAFRGPWCHQSRFWKEGGVLFQLVQTDKSLACLITVRHTAPPKQLQQQLPPLVLPVPHNNNTSAVTKKPAVVAHVAIRDVDRPPVYLAFEVNSETLASLQNMPALRAFFALLVSPPPHGADPTMYYWAINPRVICSDDLLMRALISVLVDPDLSRQRLLKAATFDRKEFSTDHLPSDIPLKHLTRQQLDRVLGVPDSASLIFRPTASMMTMASLLPVNTKERTHFSSPDAIVRAATLSNSPEVMNLALRELRNNPQLTVSMLRLAYLQDPAHKTLEPDRLRPLLAYAYHQMITASPPKEGSDKAIQDMFVEVPELFVRFLRDVEFYHGANASCAFAAGKKRPLASDGGEPPAKKQA